MCQATGHEQRHGELGIAAINRTRVIVSAQDAEPAVNNRVNENPKRQFIRGQPVKDAGNKAYTHRNHFRSFESVSRRRPCKISSNFLTSAGRRSAISVNGGSLRNCLTSPKNASTDLPM